MLEHKLLFSLMVLAALANLGWVFVIYVLSYHSARRLVDAIEPGNVPRRARVSAPTPLRAAREQR